MILIALLAAAPSITNQTVKIEGKSYRVVVKGDVVKVINKAILSGQTVEDRGRMVKAVKQVTGCDIHDPFWRESSLLGELRCPAEK